MEHMGKHEDQARFIESYPEYTVLSHSRAFEWTTYALCAVGVVLLIVLLIL